MSFLLSLTLICFKIYAPKTSSYFTKLCTNFLFMVMHTSTWLNTNCLLAQTLICLHTHTHTNTLRTFQNVCQNPCVRQRFPLTPPLLLFSSPPSSHLSFPIKTPAKTRSAIFSILVLFYHSVSICGSKELQRASWLLTSAVPCCRGRQGTGERERTKKWGIENGMGRQKWA